MNEFWIKKIPKKSDYNDDEKRGEGCRRRRRNDKKLIILEYSMIVENVNRKI